MTTTRLSLATITLLLFTLCAVPQATGQIETPTSDAATVGSDFYSTTYGAIGLHASLLSGAGISGRVTFPNRLSIQGTAFVMTAGEYTHFNIGGEGQFAFAQGDGGRLFGLVGLGYYSSTSDKPEKPGNRIASPVKVGLGIGYEWFLSHSLTLDLSAPLVTWFIEEEKVLPTVSASMHYYFK